MSTNNNDKPSIDALGIVVALAVSVMLYAIVAAYIGDVITFLRAVMGRGNG